VISYEEIDRGILALKKSLKTVSEQLEKSIKSHLESLGEIPKKSYSSPKDPLKKMKKNMIKK
jgi:hypothetical protein